MGGMEVFFFVLVLWIFSVCLHEFGHAIVAYYGGDYTVKEKGYLTMNPLLYVNPMTSIIMPIIFLLLGGIGLPGGAVYIERHLLRSRNWSVAVSLAGPGINILWTLILCIPFWAGLVKQDSTSVLACSLAFLIQLEICSVIFNLLPIPPLDGFQAVSEWMPEETRSRLFANANIFIFGTFILMAYVPAVNYMFWSKVNIVMNFLHIDVSLAREGRHLFKFW